MGCMPSTEAQATIKTEINNNCIFTIDERLKLKEVWVIVKQNGFKKLGDQIMNKALERNSSLKIYWQNLVVNDYDNLLIFDENDSTHTKNLIWKQTFKQHGYEILEKIDQLIMIMVTRISTNDANDNILQQYFHQIGQSHSKYQIKQDHIDILSESFSESIKDMMDQNGSEWTIKHAITWEKFLNLITNQFSQGITDQTK